MTHAFHRTAAGCPGGDAVGAMVAGALSEAERAAIADHAAVCDRCRAWIGGLVEVGAAGAIAQEPDELLASGDGQATDMLELGRGTRIGRYVIRERLGMGGMGVVHAAIDSELRRRVAVKLLRPDGRGLIGSNGRERLMREARTLARLAHPNVVTVFDAGEHCGHLFIAMELVDGGSLSAWLRRTPRKTDEIVERLIEAGRGLAAAHAAGLVHRDVKPDNILIGLDGRARVTDFGLAQLGDAPSVPGKAESFASATTLDIVMLTRTGMLMGTPMYMAPEQWMGGEINARTDQWSFCATLYEALAGVRPFVVDDPVARSSAIADGRLAVPARGRRVPGWIRKIVTRGLRADPAARWPSMDAVVHVLARRRHRRRRIALGLAIAVVINGLAVGSQLLGRGEPPPAAPPPEPPKLAGWLGPVDGRAGCDCPYSACEGGCVSVCRASGYTMGVAVPGISVPGQQEALLGASADGTTILYLAGPRCALDRLMLARRRGSIFASVDLTDQLDAHQVALDEGCCTLSADGRTLVLSTADRTGFIRFGLAGAAVVPADGAALGALLPSPAAGRIVRYPVLAADELTLYYMLVDPGVEPGEAGPLNGSYAAVRADLQSPFRPGRRLSGKAQQYDYVTGVSADGLSLFMAADYLTRVLVRSSPTEPFREPAATVSPALLPGWRAKPLGDCTRIVTTSTPGGCEREDIAYLEAVPRQSGTRWITANLSVGKPTAATPSR